MTTPTIAATPTTETHPQPAAATGVLLVMLELPRAPVLASTLLLAAAIAHLPARPQPRPRPHVEIDPCAGAPEVVIDHTEITFQGQLVATPDTVYREFFKIDALYERLDAIDHKIRLHDGLLGSPPESRCVVVHFLARETFSLALTRASIEASHRFMVLAPESVALAHSPPAVTITDSAILFGDDELATTAVILQGEHGRTIDALHERLVQYFPGTIRVELHARDAVTIDRVMRTIHGAGHLAELVGH